jgi:hypothetical protein
MRRELRYRTELWTLDEPFVIAGLVQRDTQLIVVEVETQGQCGRGETERDDLLAPGRPNVLEEIERMRDAVERGANRSDLLEMLPCCRPAPRAARSTARCGISRAASSGHPFGRWPACRRRAR